ncbi:TrkH family potassium uptake protein [Bremerella alba]|uniref:Ktr system potassium uptake protein B n=1 Tax=Bremerella alba TaxID=980252 RepID=A0A7V8V1D0_9BACT|nr:potassium transporter TrkG [Bremerella alba]MBA2113140.1 Ktr system potassium uptake protein B [Bremerella alba]
MAQLTGSIVKYPARNLVAWYVGLIVVGTIVLTLSICRGAGAPEITFLDAFFTATSAGCVTGLAVRSTPHDFSFTGQLAILLLIQVGGIGIMSITTFAMFNLGSKPSLRARAILTETLGADDNTDLKWILQHVLLVTVVSEGIGFAILLARNLFLYEPGKAAWHALFHSVSAFCNAGFSLHDDSLVSFQGDVIVNVTISGLIIVGGIGFPVLLDLYKNWRRGPLEGWVNLHLHSKFMLFGTAFFLLAGFGGFLFLEWNGVLNQMPLWKKLLVSGFHSVTCRTAGFNTIDLTSLTNATLFISMILMLIGAGSCSTGGGFKVSTVMVMALHAWKTFQGATRINFARRTIPSEVIQAATATALLFSFVAIVALTMLLVVQQSSTPHPNSPGLFLDAAFEIVSALGTVGLSTGFTGTLSDLGKLIIIALMFLGRIGPISVFAALSMTQRNTPVEYPKEEPLIG